MRPNLMSKILALIIAFGFVLAACGGASDTAATSPEDAFAYGYGSPDTTVAAVSQEGSDRDLAERASTAPSDVALGDGGVAAAQVPVNLGRDIIFTATMTVAVTSVGNASTQATSIIEGLGGFLFGQDTIGIPEPRTILVFKVPPARFQEALAALGSVGEIRSQSVHADDVTERVVDLESRIGTAEASVLRLRALLENATDIKQVVELENELLERETQLETMRGSLRTLEDAVSLATITLTITEALSQPALNVTVTAYPGHEDQGASCPGEGFGLAVDQGDEATTLCYELFNTGDSPLTNFTLKDPVADLTIEDMILVFGDLDGSLEPGESIILAAEISPERRTRTQTRITATAVDQDGNPVAGRTISNTSSLIIEVQDPGGLPGFSDGLSSGSDLLQITWSAANVLVGFLIGLAPILAILVGLAFWWRRRNRSTASQAQSPVTTDAPLPMPPVPSAPTPAPEAPDDAE